MEVTLQHLTKRFPATGKKGKELFHPIRLALTGQENGPELKVLLPLIGYEKAFKRLNAIKA